VVEELVLVVVEVVVVPGVVLVLPVVGPQFEFARWLSLVATVSMLVLVIASRSVAA
jgi:hypothetical protein